MLRRKKSMTEHMADYARMLELYGDIFHEWDTEIAERFFL